jgi:tetratricopeptide (TPR) repeat protein
MNWRLFSGDRSSGVFDHITRWAVYLSVFFVPLFFVPITTHPFDFNKQTLFVVLTAVAVMAWLGKMVTEKRLRFRSGWLHLIVLLFLVGVLVSGVFSITGYKTWVGGLSQEYTSVLSMIMFVLLFYVVTNRADDTKTQRCILFTLFLSATLSGLITLLSAFGVTQAIGLGVGFNTVGTINGLAGFMLATSFAGMAMWLVSDGGRKSAIPQGAFGVATKVLIVTTSLLTLFFLIAIDFWVFWAVTIAGIALMAVFTFTNGDEFSNTNGFILPIIFLLASLILWPLSSPLQIQSPIVVSPSYATSWNITLDTLSESNYHLLFGSGPGSFEQMYEKFKPQSINTEPLWNLGLDRSKSHAITSLATFGVVTTVLALALFGYLGALALNRLLRERDHEEWKMTYVMFIGWAVMLLLHAVYTSDFTRHFILWLFTGLLASQVLVNLRETDFSRAPRIGLATTFGFVTVTVFLLGSLLVSQQRYAANLSFVDAIKEVRAGNLDSATESLQSAAAKNPYHDVYMRNLSAAYLLHARQTSQEAGEEPSQEQTKEIINNVRRAVGFAERATQVEPAVADNWTTRGRIYRDLMPFAPRASQFATATYKRATELEPVNPSHHVNLGRVYLAMADQANRVIGSEETTEKVTQQAEEQRKQALDSAVQSFEKAIELKQDYGPAHYYLAGTFERQGKLDEAASRLIALQRARPADTGLGLQLGILLLRMEEYDAARQQLERLLEISPDFSNAKWFLASVYEIQDEREKALELVEEVAAANPDNSLVQKRVERMRAGELTTQIPRPVEEGATDEAAVIEESEEADVEGEEDVEEGANEADGEGEGAQDNEESADAGDGDGDTQDQE